MTSCKSLQTRMADEGTAFLDRDAEAHRHLTGCEACRRVKDDLDYLDRALGELDAPDASDELVAKTLEAVHAAPAPARPSVGMAFNSQKGWAAALAACLVLVAAYTLSRDYLSESARDRLLVAQGPQTKTESGSFALAPEDEETAFTNNRISGGASAVGEEVAESRGRRENEPLDQLAPAKNESELADLGNAQIAQLEKKRKESSFYRADEEAASAPVGRYYEDAPADPYEAEAMEGGHESQILRELRAPLPESEIVTGERRQAAKSDRDGFGLSELELPKSNLEAEAVSEPSVSGRLPATPSEPARPGESASSLDESFTYNSELFVKDHATRVVGDDLMGPDSTDKEVFRQKRERLAAQVLSEEQIAGGKGLPDNKPAPESNLAVEGDAVAQPGAAEGSAGSGGLVLNGSLEQAPATIVAIDGNKLLSEKRQADPAQLLAKSYLAGRESTEGLQFQEPRGYWSNSYLPGDPDMRLLEARLRKWQKSLPASALAPQAAVQRIPQPFDAPDGAAMALHLQADKTALQGPGRVTLQVGLKAAEVTAGHRPAMTLALVVDLRDPLDSEEARRLRALLDALSRARQAGDRFSLYASGPGGGLLAGPEDFRHGPLQVAFERILDRGTGQSNASEALGIAPALRQAADHLRAAEEAGEPRGATLLLMAGGRLSAEELPQLEEFAYRQALDGLPLSFVALAPEVSQDSLDRLMAAGQGNRRFLLEPAEAPALVEQELKAAARATARALRLNIRLAPGAKLIGIAGSHRLAEPQAEKVRATEQAIDRRLAENLGIAADRGEDDDGIQIVIPNFYAGDDHVILIDLLVEGPGPLAEVTLRYKDLRRLANGTARASLALASGRDIAGPLELNVFKNRLAADFSQRLRGVARLLSRGQAPAAATALARMRDLLRGLRQQKPVLAQDPDLLADETLLNGYLKVLARGGVTADPQMLAQSLRFAAWRKQQSAVR